MSDHKPAGPVVAELGRPETPAETAARKAESSRLHRQRQTINNLVFSLIVTLGVVLVIVLLVPRSTPRDALKPVDWRSVASQGTGAEPDPLLDPDLPKSWSANAAELRESDQSGGVDVWHIGFITPSDQYIGLDQGFKANDTWIADELDQARATGVRTIDGVKWVVYDNRDGQSTTDEFSYGMVATHGVSTAVLAGTAKPSEFTKLATALAGQLGGSTK
ncbi:DUF4245 family protein [Gryllotalpicola ginsengisoli]|uniref:DUF4245 family protein n=1 Tax=Gryllotalpicola ginsengisoli TaxID=444608 RepID=UPI0003B4BB9D|nr:DUF4245 family protein [Gryllotalpicola ginsengisoli]